MALKDRATGGGDWQGYYDQDFEAVIDLQKTRPVGYIGIHVLQDVSPWILYPKEVIFYSSEDGKNFTEAARVQNRVEQKDGPAQTQELWEPTLNVQSRYIKDQSHQRGKSYRRGMKAQATKPLVH